MLLYYVMVMPLSLSVVAVAATAILLNENTAMGVSVSLDRSGIPILNYDTVKGVEIGIQRNPVTVVKVALDNYSNYQKTGDEHSKRVFLNNADWLVNNAVLHGNGNYSLLEYDFPWPEYNLTAPWYSGMAQGQALQ